MSDSYKIYASKDYVDSKALPDGMGAYQQLVTSADGVAKWEERLAYGLPEEVVTVLEETTIEYGEGSWVNRSVSGIELVEGAEYTVMWNGTAYISTCIKNAFFGFLWIGNPSVADEGENNNMPFAVMVYDGQCEIGRLNTDAAETVTISITGRARNYKKIDAEYLPVLNANDSAHKGIVSPKEIVANTSAFIFLDIGITNETDVRNALKPMGILVHENIKYRALVNEMQGWGDGAAVINAVCAEYGIVYLKCWFDYDTGILKKIQIVPCDYAPIAKDANGNYWKIKVGTDGALSTELYEIPTYGSDGDGGVS